MLNFGVDAFYVNPGEELLGVEAEVELGPAGTSTDEDPHLIQPPKEPFYVTCEICIRRFATTRLLFYHQEASHRYASKENFETTYRCMECPETYNQVSSLDYHSMMTKHYAWIHMAQTPIFSCSRCYNVTQKGYHFMACHIRCVHRFDITRGKKTFKIHDVKCYECDACMISFEDQESLDIHQGSGECIPPDNAQLAYDRPSTSGFLTDVNFSSINDHLYSQPMDFGTTYGYTQQIIPLPVLSDTTSKRGRPKGSINKKPLKYHRYCCKFCKFGCDDPGVVQNHVIEMHLDLLESLKPKRAKKKRRNPEPIFAENKIQRTQKGRIIMNNLSAQKAARNLEHELIGFEEAFQTNPNIPYGTIIDMPESHIISADDFPFNEEEIFESSLTC
uniref:C2H2-type domain-containing protein n=1 Tax=Acrobeloides nanus TaxID=290746 RepID=A0A914CR74_9BILA